MIYIDKNNTMSLFKAYLSKPSTQRVLNRKPGDKGFSLIELVVVVAVLAILSAIAIPAFTSISADAAHAAATNTLATIAKECAVKVAKGEDPMEHGLISGANGIHYNIDGTRNCMTTSSVTTGTGTANEETTISTNGTPVCAFVNRGTPATYCINVANGDKTIATPSSVTWYPTTTDTAPAEIDW